MGVQVPPSTPLHASVSIRVVEKIMRKILKLWLILGLVSAVLAPSHSVEAAVNNVPLPGKWGWCTNSIVNGCIQSVTTTSPKNVTTVYTNSAALQVLSLDINVHCGFNSNWPACDGNKYESIGGGPCLEKSNWSSGPIGQIGQLPAFEIDISWPEKSGWLIEVRLSTGNFRAAFTIGHGTTSAITTDDGDGTFTYLYTAKMRKHYYGDYPNLMPGSPDYYAWWNTAQATDFRESVHAQVWPRDHLLTSDVSNGCKYHPFEGAWAEANASSFSWGYGTSTDLANDGQQVQNKLNFKASNYHWLPGNKTSTNLMPARIQVFLPVGYFLALGYTTLAAFDSSAYSVTTEDNQRTTPKVTELNGGLLVNLGVEHYSSPNPSISFKLGTDYGKKFKVPPMLKTRPFLSVKKSVTAKSIANYAGLNQAIGSTVSVSVLSVSSKICGVSKSTLLGIKKGTCQVKVTVKSSSGTKTSKTVSIKVNG